MIRQNVLDHSLQCIPGALTCLEAFIAKKMQWVLFFRQPHGCRLLAHSFHESQRQTLVQGGHLLLYKRSRRADASSRTSSCHMVPPPGPN